MAETTISLKNGELKESGALQYVGAGTRVGVGYESQTKLRGEFYQVITENNASALIADAWLARAAGGLKFSYHYLPSDADLKSSNLSVYKIFGALDQNDRQDRKLSLGGGYENSDHFASAYLSKSLTGRRFISADTVTNQTQISGVELNRPFIDTNTTTVYTQIFERAYDYGLGLRLGRMLEPSLLRVTGGLDYELGKSSARQGTVSLNLEKFFAGSPHSLALHLDAARKSGDYETSNNHYSAMLMYRYEFGGKAYRSEHLLRDVQVSAPAQGVVQPVASNLKKVVIQQPARTEMKIIKTTANMASDAFFQLGSAQLTVVAKTELEHIANVLKNSGYQGNIRIIGYTCDLGPAAYNIKLSRKRADAVRDYLLKKGVVTPDAVIVDGVGKSNAKYPATDAERYKNRRVEIEYVTYMEKEEVLHIPAVTVEVPEEVMPAVEAPVQWRQEEIAQEPAWMRRALHNTPQHKRTVDTYRVAEKQQTVSTSREWINQAPVAADDTFVTFAGNSLDLSVLANDRDPDGDKITLLSVTTSRFGNVSVVGDRLRYVARQGFSGQDTFTYRIRDEKGLESTAAVTVNVSVPNQMPVAADDVATTQQNFPVTVNVLSNDTDPDGDKLALASISTMPAHGSAIIKSGQIEYTPANGYTGADSFSYIVQDGRGGNATAIVRMNVVSANTVPVAQNDLYVVFGNRESTLDVLSNDSDPNGDSLGIVAVTQPAVGSVRIVGNKLIFSPKFTFWESQFTYSISDGHGGESTATVTLIDP